MAVDPSLSAIPRRIAKRVAWSLARTARDARRPAPLAQPPAIASDRFLFIGGLHRSGTSIVHRALAQHPEMSGFSDTGVHEDEGQHLQSLFPTARDFGGPGLFALDLQSSLDDLIPTWSDEQTATLLREWGAYYDLDKRILLEKSPPNLVRYPFLRHVFPDARFLFILRHPACVALATRKLTRATVPELLLHWYVGYRRLADAAPLENALVLRYEDIVRDQRAWFDQVFALAGVRPAPLEEAISDHNRRYLDEWAADYGREAEFAQHAFPEMIRFFAAAGYSLEPPFVSPDFQAERFLSSGRTTKWSK